MWMCFLFRVCDIDLGVLLKKGRKKLQMVDYLCGVFFCFVSFYCCCCCFALFFKLKWIFLRNIDASKALGNFRSDQQFLFFFPGLSHWKMSPKRKGSPRQPSHVLLQRRTEKMARETRVSWLQKEGVGSVLCWQGTCRGCGSSPQTPLNVELPQNRARCRMFAEPRANTWVASPWVPRCQDCPNLAPPGVCQGQLYPHKLQSQLGSTDTP